MRLLYRMTAATIGLALGLASIPDAMAVAAEPRQPEPPLEIELTTAQAEVAVGAPMTWRITLIPRGQAPIESIELHSGDKRAWAWSDGQQTLKTLTSTTILEITAVPLVSGELKPILEAHYNVGGEKQKELIAGDAFIGVGPQPIWGDIVSRIPGNIIAIIAGVITGALASIIPWWIEERRERRRQRKLNRQHVRGLLQLMTLQSRHAADSSIEIDLTPLETIFKEEGLFAVLEEYDLSDDARALWRAAERHNKGLKQPGGLQKMKTLRTAAKDLADKLPVLRLGYWQRLAYEAGLSESTPEEIDAPKDG